MRHPITILCLGLLLGLFSCNKDKYKGPQGDPGPAGAQGPQGVPGPAGQGSQVESTVITVQGSQWGVLSSDSVEWSATVNVPIITQKVNDYGMVQVFLRKDNIWHNLPFLDHTLFINYSYEPGKLHLFIGDSHGDQPDQPATETYKVVVLNKADKTVNKPSMDKSLKVPETISYH